MWGQIRSSSIWADHPPSLRCPLCLVWNPQGFVPSVSVTSCTRPSVASLDAHLLRTPHHSPPPTFPSQLPGCSRASGPPNISVRTHFCQAHTLNPSASLKSESILISHGLLLTLSSSTLSSGSSPGLSEEALNHSQRESHLNAPGPPASSLLCSYPASSRLYLGTPRRAVSPRPILIPGVQLRCHLREACGPPHCKWPSHLQPITCASHGSAHHLETSHLFLR